MFRRLLLIGAAQGWCFWGLWQSHTLKIWPATDSVSGRAILYLSLALPLAVYLSEGIATLTQRRRLLLLACVAILFPLLGAYSGWIDNVSTNLNPFSGMPFARPSDLFAAGILGFVLIPLLAHVDASAKRWPYRELFETAWRNIILGASAAALTGLFWMVLFAGSALLGLIGLKFAFELITKPIFAIPVTGIAFGTAFALALARAEMLITLRKFQLSLLAWLLPLLMAFILTWVIALPFTGVEALFKTRSAALILLWCVALAIGFTNAAYQDGQTIPPYNKLLRRLLAMAWIALPVVVGIAWWAMSLRIQQHGWSEDRVWGIFVLLLATLYVIGYAASSLRRNSWLGSIGTTNVCVAVVMSLGLIALLSPLADARRIAVDSQLQRLRNQTIASDKFDFDYLRWQAGKYGQQALNTLAAGIDHPNRTIIASRAKQILAQKQRYQLEAEIKSLTTAELKTRLRMLPAAARPSDALLKAIQVEAKDWQLRRCFDTESQCAVWLVDLNSDGAQEAVVLTKNTWNDSGSGNARILQKQGDSYHIVGSLQIPSGIPFSQSIEQIDRGEFRIATPTWNEVELSGQRLRVMLDKHH
jgi:hypothetical protein